MIPAVLATAVALHAQSLPTLSLNSTDSGLWRGVTAPGGTAFLVDSGGNSTPDANGRGDSQTGQTVADIVGNLTSPTIFIAYGEIGGAAHLGFRIRLDELSTAGALKQVTYIGFDFDAVGTAGYGNADLYVGLDMKTQVPNNGDPAQYWRVVISDVVDADGSGGNRKTYTNISPSTSKIAYNGTASTALWSIGTNANDSYALYHAADTFFGTAGSTNGTQDAFLSFAVPFSAFTSAITAAGITIPGGFDPYTTYRITANTSNTEQLLNQDFMAPETAPFNFSSPISSATPVPEPGTALILGALFVPFVYKRRRSQRTLSKYSDA